MADKFTKFIVTPRQRQAGQVATEDKFASFAQQEPIVEEPEFSGFGGGVASGGGGGSFDLTVKDKLKQLLPTEALRGAVNAPPLEVGQRSLLGNIFERPASAVREGVRETFRDPESADLSGFGRGFAKGATEPEDVETFQNEFLDDFFKKSTSTSTAKLFFESLPESATGKALDIITSPADLALLFAPQTEAGKALTGAVAETRGGQALGRFLTKERSIPLKEIGKTFKDISIDAARLVASKFPKIMNQKWVNGLAESGQRLSLQLDDVLGKSFQSVRGDAGNININPRNIDEILLKSDITDDVIKIIDNQLPDGVNTVDDAYFLTQVLRRKAGKAISRIGGKRGKGGKASPQIRSERSIKLVKDEIFDSVAKVDAPTAESMRILDNKAVRLFERLETLESTFGRKQASTRGLAPFLTPRPATATQFETVRTLPKEVKVLKNFLSKEYKPILKKLMRDSRQFMKDSAKFRQRQTTKKVASVGLVGGVAKKVLGKTPVEAAGGFID